MVIAIGVGIVAAAIALNTWQGRRHQRFENDRVWREVKIRYGKV